MSTSTAPRYNHTRDESGEVTSVVPGWEVTYPASCNGRLGDIGFIASTGQGGSEFVHFSVSTGLPYGTPLLTAAARDRLLQLRRDFTHPDAADAVIA